MPTPPRNPYIAGKALGDARGFFGREDVFRLVETVLSSPDQNSVVLFGQRRIGKTSILLNLDSRLPSPPFVPVYFDLMDRARKPLGDVLYELAATIAQEMNLPQPARADFDDEGHGFRERFLPTAYAALGGQKRLVLLFDEFDVLDVTQEEQLPAKAAARAFFPYLRALMTNEPRLGFVFVVGRKAEELGIEFKAAFKASRYYRVSVLDEESARALVVLAERDGLLHFADGAVERVLALTARHPYFTQLMCQLLFERAHQSQSAAGSVPTVATADVDAVVPKVLEAGENVFEWIWDGLPLAERIIFSAIAEGTSERTLITEERLLAILDSHGIRMLSQQIELTPIALIEWEMLQTTEGGYRFFVELMRRWVVKYKPLAKVKDEMDRNVPFADSLFQSGSIFHRRGRFDDATTLLKKAKEINPRHVKARLLLGEIYLEQRKFDEAVRELEEAFRIDKDAARASLEQVLQLRADSLKKAKRDTANVLTEASDYATMSTISRRLRLARLWLILILLVAVGTFVLGRSWVFADSDCPNLQILLLAVLIVVVAAVMSFQAVMARNVSPLFQITRVASVFAFGLILPVIAGTILIRVPEVRSQYCASCDQYIATAEDLHQTTRSATNPLATLEAAELYARRAIEVCGPAGRSRAADILASVLFDKAEFSISRQNCSVAQATLDEANTIARQYSLPRLGTIVERQRYYTLICTPTPTPIPTVTPTRTPTPTPIPTFTPLPPDKPKPDRACIPPADAPVTSIALTRGIAQVGPKPLAVGQFYREEFAIDYQFKGGETVCLASTADGRGALTVNDRLDLLVLVDSNLMGQWGHDFYDRATGGYSQFRPEDISSMFPATNRRYIVRLVLTDLHPEYYSSSAVYVVIWNR